MNFKYGDLIMFNSSNQLPKAGWHIGFLENINEEGYNNLATIRIIKDDGRLYSFYLQTILDSLVVLTKR